MVPAMWLAALLDLFLGDPAGFPHPVRGVGRLALVLEKLFRSLRFLPLRLAGVLTLISVVLITGGSVFLLVDATSRMQPAAGFAVSAILLYFAIAPRDLADHAMSVCRALERGDLELARQSVAMMVGRDTARLDETGVAKAAVESVAENTADGVTAPLLYGLLFGPVGAWVYKASNTLDSMFGYKNERYREFGWASARFDDLLNYIPARLTVLAVAFAAFILRLDPVGSLRTVHQCARRHESPNAGYPESAYAGALGVSFGGARSYGGRIKELPVLGLADGRIDTGVLRLSVRLMYATTAVFLSAGTVIIFLIRHLISF